MLVSFLLASALATPSSAMEERLVLARAIDAFYGDELAVSEAYLSSIVEGELRGEVSFWLSEIHLRNGDFQSALVSLVAVGDSVAPWKVGIVDVEARIGDASGVSGFREVLESAWAASHGDPRSFGVGACLSMILVEDLELSRAGEVLRAIGGDPEKVLPHWLRGACSGAGDILAVTPFVGGAGGVTVTILGERWAWDLVSGVLVSTGETVGSPCPLPAGYHVPPNTVDMSLSCRDEELWFVRHRNGESSLYRVDGSGESSFEIIGLVPATVSVRLSEHGTELMLGGVVAGEPIVAIWDRSGGLRSIPTGDWVFTAPAWIE
jgi:hypothetical protein